MIFDFPRLKKRTLYDTIKFVKFISLSLYFIAYQNN